MRAGWTNANALVEIFERCKGAIAAGRTIAQERRKQEKQRKMEQTQKCLCCVFGACTPQGFLCAVYPLGLDESQLPCPDWQRRATK